MERGSFRTKLDAASGTAGDPQRRRLAPILAAWRSWLPQALVIIAAAAWIYWPAIHGDWLWDDDLNINDNSSIRDPLGFLKVWTHANGQGDYYPLTSFVWWLEWQHLPGDTLLFHVVNVALHLLSGFLVWVLFARLELRLAWLGALIFVVHPIMVETVAWISELKNTLSLPLLLLAMIFWLDWKRGAPERRYGWSLLCFFLSLLAKISGLMLPLIFLGHAWATRGRIGGKDAREIAPFLVVIVAVVGASALTHSSHLALLDLTPHGTFAGRLVAVGWGAVFLLGKCLWPVDLLPCYPSFGLGPRTPLDVLPWLGLGGLLIVLWRARGHWSRRLFLGLAFFYINLIPVLGFIYLNYTTMAWGTDHLLYLPIIGLIGAGVALLGDIAARWGAIARMAGGPVVAIIIALMIWKAHSYDAWFVDTETLWGRTVAREPDSLIAAHYYAIGLIAHKKYAQADVYLERTRQLALDNVVTLLELGELAEQRGDMAQAETDYRDAIAAAPNRIHAYVKLGELLWNSGRRADAGEIYRKAVEVAPENAQVHYNLGKVLLESGDLAGAVEQLDRSEALDPSLPPTHENLGVALAREGKTEDAILEFRQALQLDPARASAHFDLALALVRVGQVQEAVAEFEETVRLDPNNPQANAILAKLRQAAPPPAR